jgi:hypothetical protein
MRQTKGCISGESGARLRTYDHVGCQLIADILDAVLRHSLCSAHPAMLPRADLPLKGGGRSNGQTDGQAYGAGITVPQLLQVRNSSLSKKFL